MNVWHDEFDDPSLPLWQADWLEAEEFCGVRASALHLGTGTERTRRFPLLWAQAPFPDGDFALEIRFRYGLPTRHGTTVGIGTGAYDGTRYDWDEPPIPGIEDVLSIHHFDEHYGATLFGQVAWRSDLDDTDWHVVQVEHRRGFYTLSVDGIPYGSVHREDWRPRSIYLGNPAVQKESHLWTDLHIDHIRVKVCVRHGHDRIHLPLLFK